MQLFERVKIVAVEYAGSVSKLAKKLGVVQSTFQGYFSSERENNLWPLLAQICVLFPELSRNWLYFGEGQPSDSEDRSSNEIEKLKADLEAALEGKALFESTVEAQKETITLLKDALERAKARVAELEEADKNEGKKKGGVSAYSEEQERG